MLAAVCLLGSVACSVADASPTVDQTLSGPWQFRIQPDSAEARTHAATRAWHAAQVPGEVQTDLLANKLIPDPFYRDNEAKLQWIGLADWDYRTTFQVTPGLLRHGHLDMVFDGLDTFADVDLNGHHILAADNMFRRWRVPVRAWLHPGDNTLTVTLHSPIARLLPWLLKQPYALPGEFDSAFGDEPKGKQTANYVRKAAYQYGWDWGPRFVTEGIWKPVRLEAWSTLRIADFHIAQPQVTAQAARLQAQFEIQADQPGKAMLHVEWSAPDGHRSGARQAVVLHRGDNLVMVPIRIEHPQRWWPAGYGAQNMYRFHGEVAVAGHVLASAERETGLRSVVLRRRKDKWGRSFEFVVNGVPIFAKGADLIPFDSFPTRVTPRKMEQILKSARAANMNMLRMWGGGYYESDAFYTMADRLGLMIWQDFMFGGAIPPYDKAFRDNTRVEAVQQVKRLRDHPSIVLWCGNNEVQTGWDSWSDRKKFKQAVGPVETARIEKGMRALFDHTLRDVVTTYDPTVPYWSSSPSTDDEGPANVLDNGDYHFWDVWSGSAPIGKYLDVTPRFQSEYGLQSMPVMATIDSFTRPSDRSPETPVMRAHQKFANGNGNQRLLFYIRGYYGEPKDFASFVYLSQVMQAEGIELAAEHLRASRPHAMGSLYWQLNDVWPGASWSSIDYYGRWKALQYHARRFYAPLRVVPIRKDGTTRVSVVSDRRAPFQAQLRVRVIGMDGTPVWSHLQNVRVAALASTPAGDFTDAQLLHGADPSRSVAVFDLLDHGKLLSRHVVYFRRAKSLDLPDPGLKATLSADGREVTVSAQRFAREVWIGFGDLDARLSDNAFNLLPEQSVTLQVDSTAAPDALRKAMHVRSLYGATVATNSAGMQPGTKP
ncbi:beta-mannosidase [Dyella sp. A6]|uniref:beta-mannosidase n=1 Tax=Dyella aluminiiresistens TaxID=3069105 RepID=UPI002E781BA0|nr:glycoside hydrolase family 2 protein [Dyella sp. A6]